MNNIIKLFLAFLVAGVLFSCKKNVSMVTVDGATPPTLSANKDTILLGFATKDQEAVKLMWTNPNYKFSTGISSQDVSYKIEIDTLGANFTNPNRKTVTVSKDLSVSFTQSDLNDYLLNQLNLKAAVKHTIQMRVTATLTNNSLPVVSNILKYTVTPFAIPPKITPPANGTVFIVGSATPGGSAHGWDNPIAQPSAQQFTMVSPTFFTITLPLIGAGEYKFIGVNGFWTEQWSIATQDDPTEIYGGDFIFNGANILAPPVSGNYKIDLDFQRGKFTVTKL